MRKSYSRVKRGKIFWQIIVIVSLSIAFFSLLLFLGLPLLAKFSIFLEGIVGNNEIDVLVDHTPPLPPQIETPFTATNSARVTIQGNAEPGSSVKFYLNNEPLEKTLVGNDGTFTKRVTLNKEENEILAQTVDQAGNESILSSPIYIFYIKKAPLLEIEFPPEKEYEAEKEEVEIRGKILPEARLTINNRVVPVRQDGSFSYLVTLSDGENLFEIVATDQAGNLTKIEQKIKFSSESKP